MGRLSSIRRPKVYVPAVIILAVAAILIIVIRNMTAPAVGNIDQTPPAKAEAVDPYAKPGNFSGKYISFNYPARFKKVPSKLTGSYLEVIDFHSTDSTGKLISIGVLPGSISNSGDIQFRRQQKSVYTENDSQKWLEFTKNDGTEDTFFMEHNGLLASVSATAPYNNQAGDALFVASSLKWLK